MEYQSTLYFLSVIGVYCVPCLRSVTNYRQRKTGPLVKLGIFWQPATSELGWVNPTSSAWHLAVSARALQPYSLFRGSPSVGELNYIWAGSLLILCCSCMAGKLDKTRFDKIRLADWGLIVGIPPAAHFIATSLECTKNIKYMDSI